MLEFFASRLRQHAPNYRRVRKFGFSQLSHAPGGAGMGLVRGNVMGIDMKKMVLVAAMLAVTGSAFAADMPMKVLKAPPPAPFDPWDIAFGGSNMSDYVFPGVTQSNHQPSLSAYFEPRYNANKDPQLYAVTSAKRISFTN